MDPATLAIALVAVLRPFFHGLVKSGEQIAQDAGEKVGKEALGFASRIWNALHPRLEAKPAAREAAEDAAQNPDDEDAAAALRLQIRKLLEQDPELARDLAAMLEEGKQAGIVADVVIYGSVEADRGGVAAGRDIKGNVNTQGTEPSGTGS